MLSTSPFHTAATTALRKVTAVMDQSTLHETAELASRIHLLDDSTVPDTPSELTDALRSGKVLRIGYRDRSGADTLRDIEPLGYVGKGQDWYLIGWCRLRDGIRAFRGDRMISAQSTGERAPRRSLRAEDLDIAYGTLRPVSTGEKDSQTPT
ncbi:helix-turn-helix transcriptional regulator [Rhodococcus erythropolis]|uniref:helix-turn-helix transcriptional regulator n=1 Tax=Rhodococcus erythropolis TaxID=1833 RepID=UPI0037B8E275